MNTKTSQDIYIQIQDPRTIGETIVRKAVSGIPAATFERLIATPQRVIDWYPCVYVIEQNWTIPKKIATQVEVEERWEAIISEKQVTVGDVVRPRNLRENQGFNKLSSHIGQKFIVTKINDCDNLVVTKLDHSSFSVEGFFPWRFEKLTVVAKGNSTLKQEEPMLSSSKVWKPVKNQNDVKAGDIVRFSDDPSNQIYSGKKYHPGEVKVHDTDRQFVYLSADRADGHHWTRFEVLVENPQKLAPQSKPTDPHKDTLANSQKYASSDAYSSGKSLIEEGPVGTLREQERNIYHHPLHSPKKCKICGRSNGCMHPRS